MNEARACKGPRLSAGLFLTLVLAVHCSMAVGQGAQFSIQADLQATATAGSQTPATHSITFTNPTNTLVTVTLIESNAACTDSDDAVWLSISSNGVSVPPSSTQQVTVTFDASGLLQGTYTATICAVTGTSLGNVSLPVTFNVGPVPGSGDDIFDDGYEVLVTLNISNYLMWCEVAVGSDYFTNVATSSVSERLGSTVFLDAHPNTGFNWGYWTGTDGDSTQAHDNNQLTTVTMTSDKSVLACCPLQGGVSMCQ